MNSRFYKSKWSTMALIVQLIRANHLVQSDKWTIPFNSVGNATGHVGRSSVLIAINLDHHCWSLLWKPHIVSCDHLDCSFCSTEYNGTYGILRWYVWEFEISICSKKCSASCESSNQFDSVRRVRKRFRVNYQWNPNSKMVNCTSCSKTITDARWKNFGWTL